MHIFGDELIACLSIATWWLSTSFYGLKEFVRMSLQGKTAIDFCHNKHTANMILRAGPVEKRLRAWELERASRAKTKTAEARDKSENSGRGAKANVTEVTGNKYGHDS